MSQRGSEQEGKIPARGKQYMQKVHELLKEIELRKEQAEKEGLNFSAPTEEQLNKKLANVITPIINFSVWTRSSASPGMIEYKVDIKNPDVIQHKQLFAHVFIGPANFVSDIGTALATVDTRFPRLTLPQFRGLTLDPGAAQSLSFSIPIPGDIQPSFYLGNVFLFRADFHDVGDYLDRGQFVFEVT